MDTIKALCVLGFVALVVAGLIAISDAIDRADDE